MAVTHTALDSIEKLDGLIERSNREPLLIFKHSSSCGISAMVIRRMDEVDAEVNVLVVQDARDVSDAIEERTGIRHESPQAIILKNGEAIYYSSHYSINPQAIMAELNS